MSVVRSPAYPWSYKRQPGDMIERSDPLRAPSLMILQTLLQRRFIWRIWTIMVGIGTTERRKSYALRTAACQVSVSRLWNISSIWWWTASTVMASCSNDTHDLPYYFVNYVVPLLFLPSPK